MANFEMTPTVKAAIITVAFSIVAVVFAYRSDLINRWMAERKEDTVENRYRIERLESLQMTPSRKQDE